MLICVVFLSFNEEVKFQILSLTKLKSFLFGIESQVLLSTEKKTAVNREEMYMSLLLISQNVVPSPSSSRLKLVPTQFKISSDCI